MCLVYLESVALPPSSLADFFKELHCTLFLDPKAPNALPGDLLRGVKEWITSMNQDYWDKHRQGTRNSTWIQENPHRGGRV